MAKHTLYGCKAARSQERRFKDFGAGVFVDDNCPGDLSLVAVMPNGDVVQLGKVDMTLSQIGQGGLVDQPIPLENGDEVYCRGKVSDFVTYAVEYTE